MSSFVQDPEEEQRYDDDYEIPLHHKRPFGSGIRRQRVKFVKASDTDLSTIQDTRPANSGSSISDMYLSLVLPDEKETSKSSSTISGTESSTCAVCNLPLAADEAIEALSAGVDGKAATTKQRHEASIAHQVCVTHSHPPSALDRSRMGLTYLSSHGWDPDSRKGLGNKGQGIQYPLKTKPKDDKLGLGLVVPKDFKGRVEKKKPVTLDAKKSRRKAEADKKKGEKLREMFYGSEDVQRYLGSG